MRSSRPFFPDDKPRSWVIAISAGLLGLLLGSIAFGAAWAGLQVIKTLSLAAFVACWATFAICWAIFFVGQLSGRYRNMRPRPWREQVW
jgi:uncharacterized membrane protein YGL010W